MQGARGFPTPPPSRLLHPALLGSQACRLQASARLLRADATAGGSCSPSASASSAFNKHHDVLQDVCVFCDQRATHCRECFPTLSGRCGKAKGEEGFSGCAAMSFHPSAAAGDASLALSQPPAPKQQGRAAQESLAGSPGNPLFRAQECWSVLKSHRSEAEEQAIPSCRKASERGQRPAWLGRELLLELPRKQRLEDHSRQGRASQEDDRADVRICREKTREAKAPLELQRAIVVPDGKKGFY